VSAAESSAAPQGDAWHSQVSEHHASLVETRPGKQQPFDKIVAPPQRLPSPENFLIVTR
jgi:hypothetical protein